MPSNRGKINGYLIYIIDWWLDPIEIIREKSPLFSIKSMKNTILCLLFYRTEYFCLYKLLYFTSLLIMKNKDYLLQNMAASVRFLTMRMLSLFLLSLFYLRTCCSSPSMQPPCHDDESHAMMTRVMPCCSSRKVLSLISPLLMSLLPILRLHHGKLMEKPVIAAHGMVLNAMGTLVMWSALTSVAAFFMAPSTPIAASSTLFSSKGWIFLTTTSTTLKSLPRFEISQGCLI